MDESNTTELELLRQKCAKYEEEKALFALRESDIRAKEAFYFALFNYSPVWTVVVDVNGRVVRSNRAKRTSGGRLPNIGDIMYKDYASHHANDMYGELMRCIQNKSSKTYSEIKYGDRYLSITLTGFEQGAIITSQDITERKTAELDRQRLIGDLRRALDEVEALRGFIPICAQCKSIRDDKGLWNTIETYISRHSFVDFSHTLCPECVKVMYPEIWEAKQRKTTTTIPVIAP